MFLATNITAGTPGPGDDFWYAPVGARTAAGQRVTTTAAMQLSTVFKCVRAISETVAMLPLPVYRRLERGKQRSDEHPIARLLRNPNPWQTEIEFRTMLQWHACMRGNGVAEIVYGLGGQPEMLVPLNPERIKFELTDGGALRYRYTDERNRERVLVSGEVLHLMGVSSDGRIGINPIEAERESIGAAIITRDYGARFFANSSRPPTWVEATQPFKDDAARRKWSAEFQQAFSGENAGRSPVFEKGMKLHALSISNVDSQWLEARKAQDIDIAGIFRVPPHKIGILDRATWANIEHQALEFVTDCILPWCVRWEQALLRDLPFGDAYFPEHLIDMLLRGDTKTRYEAYGKGIQDGWMTRNEARQKENLNPIEGLDTPLEPMNMAPAGSRGAAQQRGSNPDARAQLIDARALAIQTAAAERIARKESAALQKVFRADDVPAAIDAAFGEQHARFVGGVLAVDIGEASACCQALAERLKQQHADGSLGRVLLQDFETARVAELCRLGADDRAQPVTARDMLRVVSAVAQRPVQVHVEPVQVSVPEREVHVHAGDTSVTVMPTPPRVKEIDRDENGFITRIAEVEKERLQ